MNDGGPAFPNTDGQTAHKAGMLAQEGIMEQNARETAYVKAVYDCNKGMTLRDWFAGQALAAMQFTHQDTPGFCARNAYARADAMIAEREKVKP